MRPNHPLRYGGKEIYLNSFAQDETTPSGFVLAIYDSTRSLAVADVTLGVGQEIFVDEIEAVLSLGGDSGARLEAAFEGGRRESHIVRQHLTLASDGPSGYQFLMTRAVPSLLVTLEVVREPGQWLVVLGLVLLSIGVFSALYLSPRQVWSIVEPLERGKSSVLLAGRAARNREGFSREFEAVRRALEELA